MRPEAEQDFRRPITGSQNAKTNLNLRLTLMFVVIMVFRIFSQNSINIHPDKYCFHMCNILSMLVAAVSES